MKLKSLGLNKCFISLLKFYINVFCFLSGFMLDKIYFEKILLRYKLYNGILCTFVWKVLMVLGNLLR